MKQKDMDMREKLVKRRKCNKHAGIVFQGPGIEEGQGLESFCFRDQMKQKPQVDPETGRLDLLWG